MIEPVISITPPPKEQILGMDADKAVIYGLVFVIVILIILIANMR